MKFLSLKYLISLIHYVSNLCQLVHVIKPHRKAKYFNYIPLHVSTLFLAPVSVLIT